LEFSLKRRKRFDGPVICGGPQQLKVKAEYPNLITCFQQDSTL